YLLKDAAASELELALRSVLSGKTYLSPAVSRHVVEGFLRREERDPDPLAALPSRQREILQLIAEGRGTKEIAGLLGIGVKTVETHRARLMERLDIHDVAGLVRFAIRSGLVSPEGEGEAGPLRGLHARRPAPLGASFRGGRLDRSRGDDERPPVDQLEAQLLGRGRLDGRPAERRLLVEVVRHGRFPALRLDPDRELAVLDEIALHSREELLQVREE